MAMKKEETMKFNKDTKQNVLVFAEAGKVNTSFISKRVISEG